MQPRWGWKSIHRATQGSPAAPVNPGLNDVIPVGIQTKRLHLIGHASGIPLSQRPPKLAVPSGAWSVAP